MVRLSNNNSNSVRITTQSNDVSLRANNDTDITADMNGNSQRAKSWAVGAGLIDGVDYSAKYYALLAQEIEQLIASDTNNAHIWAEGTDEEVEALGGEHSSKGWVNYVLTNPPTASIEQTETGATITIHDINGTTTADITNGADGANGQDGADGSDGFSPIATVTKSGSTATISITDANGTTTTTVTDGQNGTDGQDGADGQDGSDGFSPIATVSKSGDTATISITDVNGTTTTTITDGTNGQNGQDGAAATIAVGTVTTGSAGSSASVTNSGTSSAAVFDFTIPRGDKGETGSTGATGNGVVNTEYISSSGLVDTYHINYTNGNYDSFTVTNGANGTGSVADVWVNGVSVLDGDTAKIDLTNYVTTDTAQDISGRKTFLGEKAIYFKQTATTDKLGFTLYNPSSTELGALEWRPNTINGNALLALNCPQSGSNYVGFRYWSNINIIAPRPTTNGNYFIPVNITDGNTTVTANNNGTLNISTLLPNITVDQIYDATSANAQSGVAIAGAGFLQNTATGIDANNITILGTPTTQTYGLNIGASSSVTASNGVAIGSLTKASGIGATAIGVGANATARRAIQIGLGTNGIANTFSLGFDNSNNWQLLDGTTGLIPDARISSNIARTSSLATVATTGAYSDLSGIPTIPTLYSTTGQNTDGAMTQKASTDTFANVSLSNLGATATNNIDGQWVDSFVTLANGVTVPTSTDTEYNISTYLPSDGYNYEVLFSASYQTTATSRSSGQIRLFSDLISNSVFVCACKTRASADNYAAGCVILPIGTGRKISVMALSGTTGTYILRMFAYRRIGTNQ